MPVVAGQPFTVSILDGYPLSGVVGARVEVPVTRQIVSFWKPAVKASGPLPGESTWSVTLDYVPSPGDYLIVWRDNQSVSAFEVYVPLTVLDPAHVVAPVADFPEPDLAQIKPTVADVGAIERIRTTDRGGTVLGTFNSQTTPTDATVTTYINDATDMVLTQLPEQFPTRYYAAVKRAITLQAALFVESSDYPESNEPDVARKERLLATLLGSLNARIDTDYKQSYNADEAVANASVLV